MINSKEAVLVKYSKEHIWVKVDGDIAEIGLTEHKRSKMRKLIFVDITEENEEVNKGDKIFGIETKKKQFDFLSPVSGEIIECNEEVSDDPEVLDEDTEEKFIVKIKMTNPDEINELLSEDEYKNICE